MPATISETKPRGGVYDPGQVAELLNVSRQTITDWTKAGRLPKPLRIGRTIRWRREVIEALLAGQADA